MVTFLRTYPIDNSNRCLIFSKLYSFIFILFTYLFTPWYSILFEKDTATQLVKKYPAFLWNPKVHYRVYKSPPLDSVLSQLNPVRPIDSYLPKAHFILSSHLRLGLPSGLLPSGLPTKTL